MEKLNIREIIAYPFRFNGWFLRFVILFILAFVPILGWSVIVGYMLKISKGWCDEDNKKYPQFSKILDMLGKGFIILLTLAIFLIPVYPLIMIPSAGIVIAYIWIFLFIFISPYLVSKYADTEHIEGVFNFSAIIKFIQKNIFHLVEAFAVDLILLIVVSIPSVILIYAGRMIIQIPKINAIGYYIGWLSIFLGGIVALFGLLYFEYVFFSLAGNIYGLSIRGDENDEVQQSAVPRAA